MANDWFHFKKFSIFHDKCAHKVGTDGVLLGAWIEAEDPGHILDIGSGSGLISLMLAQRFPRARISGIELDQGSYKQSLENIRSSPFRSRINIQRGDFLSHAFPEKFDLIVSNPPFFRNATLSGENSRDQARHEFSLPHEKMLEKCITLLHNGGTIALILPVEESEILKQEALSRGLFPIRQCTIRNKPTAPARRCLLQFSKEAGEVSESVLLIRNESGEYSEEYRKLTRDFYLNF